jgi:hypothetical protein
VAIHLAVLLSVFPSSFFDHCPFSPYPDLLAMMSVILRFPSDRLASFTVSFGAASASRYMVAGTKGLLSADPAYYYSKNLRPRTNIGDDSPEPSGEERLIDVEIARAAYRACDSGRSVPKEWFIRRFMKTKAISIRLKLRSRRKCLSTGGSALTPRGRSPGQPLAHAHGSVRSMCYRAVTVRERFLPRAAKNARWSYQVAGTNWDAGTNLDYLQELVGYWRDTYDRRRKETTLNRFAHYRSVLDDIGIHFIHAGAKGHILFHSS